MPRPALRSTSLRKVLKRVPGGAFLMHYSRRKPSVAACARCKKPLKGIARKRPANFKKLSAVMRRPSRPYGGNLCSRCTRETIKELKLKR